MASGRASRMAMTGVALLLAACHEPRQTGLVIASAAVEPAVLASGEVRGGEGRPREGTTKTAGSAPSHALEILRLDGNPSFTAELQGSGKVMPGADKKVIVSFPPLREGAQGDRLQISTDAEHR